MRIHSYLLLFLIILTSTFFCSNLPFDSDTSLGSDILNDKDPLLTVFDAKFCEDTLTLATDSSYSSFVDMSGSIKSGLHKNLTIALGKWQNEHAFAYFEFDTSSIKKWVDTVNTNNNYEFLSFSFNFTNHLSKSDQAGDITIELGYYDTVKKDDTLMLDTTRLREIAHYTYKADEPNNHKIDLNAGYIFNTIPVISKTSQKNINGYLHIIEQGPVPVDTTILDTIDAIQSFVKDTVIIATIVDSTNDTTYTIGFITFTFDTMQNTVTYPKDTSIYDSITPVTSLVKENQLISYFSSDSMTIGDTITHYWDTVLTVPETTVVYDINTTIIHQIIGPDTVDVIQYDTFHILTTISQDTIFQASIKSPKTSLIFQTDSTTKWDSSICLYARLDSIESKSMQFFDNVSLKLQYIKLSKNDTITKTFEPSYYEVSVFESDPPSLDTVPLSSCGSGRYALLELDLKPIWNSMKDSSGKIVYRNIPKANLTISLDTVILHKSAGDIISINYTLFGNSIDSIESIDKSKTIGSITTTTKHVGIPINNFLIDLLYESNQLPDTGYLYLWLSPLQFAHIRWKIPDEGFPIDYIVSDLD